MNSPEKQAYEMVTAQTEALDMIGTELRWLLDECVKKNVQPNTPLSKEMVGKFFQLYKDFQKVRTDGFKLVEAIDKIQFDDPTIGTVYKLTARVLVEKCFKGIFAQFTSVAETGKLPLK